MNVRLACVGFFGALAAGVAAGQSPVRDPASATSTIAAQVGMPDYMNGSARVAWQFAEHFMNRKSGIVAAVPFYDYATVWDLGSSLAMLYCARELGFLGDAEYKTRMHQALGTIGNLKLFDNVAFNKAYRVSTGSMVDRQHRSSSTGIGWSATDMGRLLIWLRIVADRDAEFVPDAQGIVKRLDFSQMVKDGYLWGAEIGADQQRRVYQEGQIGYEQYAAEGYALWGARAERALRLAENETPIEVMGQTLAADKRQRDRLTSEPFVLAGLEYGWSPEMDRLARAVLAAQQERSRRTGIVTVVSEDAVDVPPHFFYYYCVLANGREFSIDVQDPKAVVDKPRWVSTKAAFGWHALLPSDYTRRALQAVEPARGARGWSSGVYEDSTRSTGTLNVNTAAVVMAAALYTLRHEPLLDRRATMNAHDNPARTEAHDHQVAIR